MTKTNKTAEAPAAVPARKRLYLGVTASRHAQIGVHAVINARAGNQALSDRTNEDWELIRDARAIRDRIANRTRFYGFSSKFFRRNGNRFAHLISTYED